MKKKMLPSTSSHVRERKRVLLLIGWQARSTEQGIVRYAKEAGWSLNLHAMRTGTLPEPEGIDGVLCLLGGVGSRIDMTEFARQVDVPVVDMHSDEAATVKAGRVLIDNLQVGRLAADHFEERGFTRCLFVCKSLIDHSARDRWKGFSEGLKKHEMQGDVLECFPGAGAGADQLSPRQCIDRLKMTIAESEYPLAIFAENDDFAMFVLEACDKLKVRVPEEVALLGCGNHSLIVDFAPVPLSSVGPDFNTRAYRAAQLLDQLMAGEPIPKEPIFIESAKLVTRRSTDILAVDDLRVATALDLIRRSYSDKNLNTTTIAETTGVTMRTLARLFNSHIGWSVAEEIKQTRIRKACRLLEETGLTLSEIADQIGFGGLQHFRRNFKQTTGLSPRDWRLKHDADT